MFRKSISTFFLLGLLLHFGLRTGWLSDVYDSLHQDEMTMCGSSYLHGITWDEGVSSPALAPVPAHFSDLTSLYLAPAAPPAASDQHANLRGCTAYAAGSTEENHRICFQPPRTA